MLLMESLARTPDEQLQRIARAIGMDPSQGRTVLERELAASLADRAWLQGMLAELSDEEWAALKVVFFNGGDQGITVELCHQIVNLLSGKRRKSSAKAVEELQDRGLIYLRAQNYRQVFYIPTDLLSVMTDIMNRQMVYRICAPIEAAVRPTLVEQNLIEDLHRFLAYVYRNDIALTQQGQIYKRHLRALLDLLATDGGEDESLVGRYPEPLGLLVGFAMDRRLIQRAHGHLLPAERLDEWIAETTGTKQLDLFRYWQDRYFYQDLQTFLSIMRSVGDRWVSLGKLVLEVEPLINPSQRGSFLLRLKHHLSTFLTPLGLFELAESDSADEPDLLCRITQAGVSVLEGQPPTDVAPITAPFLLQATFEIIVTRPVSAEVLWKLELVADLERRTDRTLTYRIGRASVYRALKTGMSGDAILVFLLEHSATGVPQNVAFDVSGWAKSYGQVYLQAVTLLRCDNELLAQQVKASRRTAPFVLGELSATDLIVDGSRARELLDALEADGLMPRAEIDRSGPVE